MLFVPYTGKDNDAVDPAEPSLAGGNIFFRGTENKWNS